MVLTDDQALADRLRLLRNLAFEPGRRFLHRELGFNFRLTNVQAAMGLAQVERIDETVDAQACDRPAVRGRACADRRASGSSPSGPGRGACTG